MAEDAPKTSRHVVSLPAETIAQVDTLGAKLHDQISSATGADLELSRAQVIQLVIKQAATSSDASEPAPAQLQRRSGRGGRQQRAA